MKVTQGVFKNNNIYGLTFIDKYSNVKSIVSNDDYNSKFLSDTTSQTSTVLIDDHSYYNLAENCNMINCDVENGRFINCTFSSSNSGNSNYIDNGYFSGCTFSGYTVNDGKFYNCILDSSNIWNGGHWENSTGIINFTTIWKGGVWNSGLFNNPYGWSGGTFNGGTFALPAVWYDGIANGGTFSGITWHNGLVRKADFVDGCVFENGVFNSGIFNDSIFSGGTFNNGNMYNSIIEGGKINYGFISGCTINNCSGITNGIFIDDIINSANIYSIDASNLIINGGSFYNGNYNNVIFNNGDIYNGNYDGITGTTGLIVHNGTFKNSYFDSTNIQNGNFTNCNSNKVNWEYGVYTEGQMYDSIWQNGNWNDGIFSAISGSSSGSSNVLSISVLNCVPVLLNAQNSGITSSHNSCVSIHNTTYYINSSYYSTATKIWLNSDLTGSPVSGWYSDGINTRQCDGANNLISIVVCYAPITTTSSSTTSTTTTTLSGTTTTTTSSSTTSTTSTTLSGTTTTTTTTLSGVSYPYSLIVLSNNSDESDCSTPSNNYEILLSDSFSTTPSLYTVGSSGTTNPNNGWYSNSIIFRYFFGSTFTSSATYDCSSNKGIKLRFDASTYLTACSASLSQYVLIGGTTFDTATSIKNVDDSNGATGFYSDGTYYRHFNGTIFDTSSDFCVPPLTTSTTTILCTGFTSNLHFNSGYSECTGTTTAYKIDTSNFGTNTKSILNNNCTNADAGWYSDSITVAYYDGSIVTYAYNCVESITGLLLHYSATTIDICIAQIDAYHIDNLTLSTATIMVDKYGNDAPIGYYSDGIVFRYINPVGTFDSGFTTQFC